MGAATKGFQEGRKAGQRHGRRAGQNIDSEENRFKEDGKAALKGAAGGAAEGAARGAVKGGVDGVKTGAKTGAEIGKSIPYIGAAAMPIGAVLGATLGGVTGTAVGGTTGALSGATTGAEEGITEAEATRARDKRKSLFDRLKDIFNFKENKRKTKSKLIFLGIIIAFVFFALAAEGVSEETSTVASNTVNSVYVSSNSESAELYNSSGSLLLATEDELNTIRDDFMANQERTNEAYYNALSTKYSGNQGSTVANRIENITTNFEAGEFSKVDKVENNISRETGAVNLSEERTIFEHILRSEKYNFNNIIWRSFVKDGDGVKKAGMTFQVDSVSGLQYPSVDSSATNSAELDLNFFITKVRPYLQSWYIPFDLVVGTVDQTKNNLNTKFAYEIMASGYHEIVMDRYKMENLKRTTNYRVYDQTTTTYTTTRTCADYTMTITEVGKDSKCSKDDYNKGLCKDAKLTYQKACTDKDFANNLNGCKNVHGTRNSSCSSRDYEDGKYGCKDKYTVNCTDRGMWKDSECSYGKLKKAQTTAITKKYCTDTRTTNVKIDKDIRETIQNVQENKTYSWNYVIALAKLFDNVISNDYDFNAYPVYNKDNYNAYIGGTKFTSGTTEENVEAFAKSEQSNSRADSYSHVGKEFTETPEPSKSTSVFPEGSYTLVDNFSNVPSGWVKDKNTEKSQEVNKVVETYKEGMEYTDKYEWNDTLEFIDSTSGIYNLSSVTDVTGDDLTYDDREYYNAIYRQQKINLIDLLNSDKDIYDNYLTTDEISLDTENIGMTRDSLDISYNVLRKDLQEIIEKFNAGGLMYGSSLGLNINSFQILDGLDFTGISNIPAGSLDGYNVAYPIAEEDLSKTPLKVKKKYGLSYGYAGHGGVDIALYYKDSDLTACEDTGEVYSKSYKKDCPYVRGPVIYAAMDGIIKEVGFTTYNKWHHTGIREGKKWEGKLRISSESGWGCYVKVQNADGSGVVYSHLYPDKEHFIELAKSVGEPISAGTPIGHMGNTGNSSGIHLHIEFAAKGWKHLGGGKGANSTLTYNYLMNIINAMNIKDKVIIS